MTEAGVFFIMWAFIMWALAGAIASFSLDNGKLETSPRELLAYFLCGPIVWFFMIVFIMCWVLGKVAGIDRG